MNTIKTSIKKLLEHTPSGLLDFTVPCKTHKTVEIKTHLIPSLYTTTDLRMEYHHTLGMSLIGVEDGRTSEYFLTTGR